MPTEPHLNPELHGHAAAEAAFLDALQKNKLPHAWLISGVRGIGKATLAHRIARYLLAGAPAQEAEAPGLFGPAEPPAPSLALPADHPIFGRLASGAHSDLLVLQSEDEEGEAKEITVDEVRKIQHFFALSSGETGWRIVIIDGADAMNRNAANALLKMLEEPPAQTLLLLVSHNLGAMLPTIKSRCRSLKLSPLSDTDLARIVSPAPTAEILAIAAGSPGLAQKLGSLNCTEMLARLRSLIDRPQEAYDLAEKLTRKGSEASWESQIILLRHVVATHIRSAVITGGLSPALMELWEKTSRILPETEGLNMDKKAALIDFSAAL